VVHFKPRKLIDNDRMSLMWIKRTDGRKARLLFSIEEHRQDAHLPLLGLEPVGTCTGTTEFATHGCCDIISALWLTFQTQHHCQSRNPGIGDAHSGDFRTENAPRIAIHKHTKLSTVHDSADT